MADSLDPQVWETDAFRVATDYVYGKLPEAGLIDDQYMKEGAAEAKKLISGGPMMGVAMYTLDVPVQKTSSALLAFEEDEVEEFESSPCIRCGR